VPIFAGGWASPAASQSEVARENGSEGRDNLGIHVFVLSD
jgi:hypothetical protein